MKSKSGISSYLYPYCMECARARARENYRSNIPRARATKAKNYEKNKERDRAYAVQYRASHKARNAELDREYKIANRARLTANQNARYEVNARATPKWLSLIHKALIQEFYEIARCLKTQTGVKHHVDHIFPLRGKGFCGLNVPWNLRVISASDNVKKHAKIPIEFKELFWMAA